MPTRLLYRDEDGRDAAVDLPSQGAFLGRAADCVVRTDDAMVSRKNCKIWLIGSRWMVEDLGSSNGTFVNEVRVHKQELRHSDVIRCGTLQVRFVEVQEALPVALSSPSPSATMINTARLMCEGQGAAGVQVDPDYANGIDLDLRQEVEQLDAALLERDALSDRLRDAEKELEVLRLQRESQGAEAQRLRGELVNLREQAGDLGRQKAHLEEELHAQVRVTEQLRRDVELLTKEQLQLRTKTEQAMDELASRDHRLERSQEDLLRTKHLLDEHRLKLAELERTKDAGWRELNSRSSELEHLRSVIAEQERILEERRMGLMTLESSTKELRKERDQLTRGALEARSERDAAYEQLESLRSRLEAFEDGRTVSDNEKLWPEWEKAQAATTAATGPTGEYAAPLEVRLVELEEELAKMGTELALLRAQPTDRGDQGDGAALRRVETAYHGINDLMSELRTNIVLARDLVFEERAHLSIESGPALVEAIAIAIDRTEEAKGLLRSLRETFEGCH